MVIWRQASDDGSIIPGDRLPLGGGRDTGHLPPGGLLLPLDAHTIVVVLVDVDPQIGKESIERVHLRQIRSNDADGDVLGRRLSRRSRDDALDQIDDELRLFDVSSRKAGCSARLVRVLEIKDEIRLGGRRENGRGRFDRG